MKILAVGVLSTTLTAGLIGSVAAYRSQIEEDVPAERRTSVAAQEPSPDRSVRPRVRWAPCPADSKLERGVCVTDVVRTVVLPAPAPSPTPAAPARTARPAGEVADHDDRDDRDDRDEDDDERDDGADDVTEHDEDEGDDDDDD